VTVTDDVFRDVIVQKTPERLPGGRFAVIIEILASGQQASSLQYRVSPTGAPEQGQWKTATTNADGSRSLLTGPSLREGPADTVYHLVIEARDADQRIVARYPLEFELEKGDYIRQR
jgi:hypothetical protein